MSRYAWVITRDHDGIDTADGKPAEAAPGTYLVAGPSGASDAQLSALTKGEGRAFRIYDDDGVLYYSGRYLGPTWDDLDFGPLDDYGRPNAGATEIRYCHAGRWTSL